MAEKYRQSDLISEVRRMQEQIRRLWTRLNEGGVVLVTHSFIVGGPIDTDIYIPPAYCFFSTYWYGEYGAFCRVGTVSVSFKNNGTTLTTATGLPGGTKIRAVIDSATGAADMTAWYTLREGGGG